MSKAIDDIGLVSQKSVALFERLDEALKSGTAAQLHSLFAELDALVDENRLLLRLIGVGHAKLDLVRPACPDIVISADLTAKVNTVSELHGFHCKLTGAGGGGCAISFLRDCTPCMHVL